MAFITSGLNYSAENFGIGDCFVTTGLTWKAVAHDGASVNESGGTKNILGRLINDAVYARVELTSPRVGTYTKAQLISANGNQAITMVDIGNADPDYCIGTPSPTCTPGTRRCRTSTTIEQCNASGDGWYDVQTCGTGYTCQNGVCVATGTPAEKPVTGPLEVYVGGGTGCDPGAPSVTLDTSEAFAFFKSTPYEYIGVGGIQVHNTDSTCRAYFAWEARVWDGYGYTECPLTAPEMQEITRYLAEATGRPLSLTRLDASETDTIWGSFEVPPAMEGEKTICLSLWGNFDYAALIAELNAAGYYDKL